MSIRRKLNPISRKALALMLVTLMSMATAPHKAFAEDLDEAIDAELDELAEGDAPSTEPESANEAGKSDAQADADSLDDIQLDDGDETVTAEAAPITEAPKVTEAPKATEADDPVIDETLDLNEEEGLDVAEPTNVPPVEDESVEPEGEDSKPAVAITKKRPVTIDPANEAYEKRLMHLSSGYKQVPDVNWDEIVGDRRQENYGLQRGDTLWDISETFFGDGFFWAKLWSQNGVIGNPHMILRGKGIRFVAGTEGEAPAIGVMDTLVASNQEIVSINPLQETVNERPTYREQVESEITPEEVESGVVLETDELIPAPELPPPSKRVPLLKELPASFHLPVQAQLTEEYDSSGVKGPPAIRAREPATAILNSFILDRQPTPLGKTDEIETQERSAHQGQAVFVRLNREVAPGTKITFARIRPRPPGASGPVVDVQGIGVIGETVNEGRNAYRATIISSISAIEKNSTVFDFAPPSVKFTRDGRRNESQITVVGGEYDDQRKIVGAGSVIYLAGGTNVGLRVGDIMGVEAVRGERRETSYPKVKRSIAIIKIADVREKVATAVVLVSTEPVVIGDRTGGAVPESLPSLRSESAEALTNGFSMNELAPEEPVVPQSKAPVDGDGGQNSDDLDATLDE